MFPFFRKTGIYSMIPGMIFLAIYGVGQFINTDATLLIGKLGFILIMLAALLFFIDILIDSFFNPLD